jgi:uncharacterized protein
MRRLLIAALFLAVCRQAAAAPASAESVETLLALSRVESMMDVMFKHMEQLMLQGMRQGIGERSLTPQQQRAVEQMPAKLMAVLREELNWASLKPQFVQLYVETFEQDEIDGLIAFYRSPAGEAFVNKMPVVMQKSMQISQAQLQQVLPRMRQAVEDAIREVMNAK